MKTAHITDRRRAALSVLILVAVLIVSVVLCAYTLGRINQITARTTAKNNAVRTASDMAELLASVNSAADFGAAVNQHYAAVRQTDDTRFIVDKQGIRYRLKLTSEERTGGTMLVLKITARRHHQTVYTLRTKKFCKTS